MSIMSIITESLTKSKENFKKLSTTKKIISILCLPISITLIAFSLLVYALLRVRIFVDDHLRGIILD